MSETLLDLIVNLIEAALKEFGYSECPHCQTLLDKNVDRQDIEKWLRREK